MTDSITSLSNLIDAANLLRTQWNGEIWWRGQSSVEYQLAPGVFRQDRGTRSEQNLSLRFRQYAKTRHPTCPQNEDYCSWLFLAQHHGLPTRLLDWSESALVATYFAVAGSSDCDAAIYALHPREMNRVTNGDHTLVPVESSAALTLFKSAFDDRTNASNTVALLAHELDPRMLVQQGTFTIHGCRGDMREIDGLANLIRKFTIPLNCKAAILEELASLGIRRRTLFPDLANLADDLKQLVFSEVGSRTA